MTAKTAAKGGFTPGPWICHTAEFKGDGVVAYEIKMPEAVISRQNCDLIAAAPELYAALKLADYRLTYLLVGQPQLERQTTYDILDKVRAAIKKAEAIHHG